MRMVIVSLTMLLTTLIVVSCDNHKEISKGHDLRDRIIRIAEIEIDSNYIDEYKSLLKEEAEASVKLETGVVCIYPMVQKETPTEIRILEIYASRDAYNAHLKTTHFLKYKTMTQKMVKSLQLVDMEALDSITMTRIFRKLKK